MRCAGLFVCVLMCLYINTIECATTLPTTTKEHIPHPNNEFCECFSILSSLEFKHNMFSKVCISISFLLSRHGDVFILKLTRGFGFNVSSERQGGKQ